MSYETLPCVECDEPVQVDEYAAKRGVPVSHELGECCQNLRTQLRVAKLAAKAAEASATTYASRLAGISDLLRGSEAHLATLAAAEAAAYRRGAEDMREVLRGLNDVGHTLNAELVSLDHALPTTRVGFRLWLDRAEAALAPAPEPSDRADPKP